MIHRYYNAIQGKKYIEQCKSIISIQLKFKKSNIYFFHFLGFSLDLVEYLIGKGANVNVVKNNPNKDTALILAVYKG